MAVSAERDKRYLGLVGTLLGWPRVTNGFASPGQDCEVAGRPRAHDGWGGWSLPRHLKSRDGITKWLVRESAYRHLPRELLERKKMGFDVPVGAWLRGPLCDWAEDLLDARRLKREGILRPGEIRARWRKHLDGRSNWQGPLWVLLMFQAWKQRWLPAP
jgi:asparagine synthetase B (glutamine-hydrolysing)